MTGKAPREKVMHIRITQEGYDAIAAQADVETRSWPDMARLLWQRGLAASGASMMPARKATR